MTASTTTRDHYHYTVVRQFTIMTVIWGFVGMLVGVWIALQLAWPELNFDLAWLSYGRLRPLHTNAVIFAFGGCALFATSYYVVQRTCHVPLFAPGLAAFTFWGWQLVIVLAAVTLPLEQVTRTPWMAVQVGIALPRASTPSPVMTTLFTPPVKVPLPLTEVFVAASVSVIALP